MRIYFVRHAQSGNNACQDSDQVRYEGRVPDPELTQIGREQAKCAAEWLLQYTQIIQQNKLTHGHDPVSAILCSPMTRALQTAEALNETFPNVIVIALPDLCEVGGLFSGPRKSPVGTPRASRSPSRSHSPSQSCVPLATASTTSQPLLTTPQVQTEGGLCAQIAGSSRDELLKRFPFVRLPAHAGCHGWWNQQRETNEQAIERAWTVARALWNHAEQNPHATLLIITHGLFQDLLLKVFLSSTLIKQQLWPKSAEMSRPSICLTNLGVGSSTASTPLKDRVTNTNAKTSDVTAAKLLGATLQWPSTHVPEGEDPYISHDRSFFLSNNVGVSLIELNVTNPCNGEIVENLIQQTNQQNVSIAVSSGLLNTSNIYRCGILFWNQHLFLSNTHLTSSGQSIDVFSLF